MGAMRDMQARHGGRFTEEAGCPTAADFGDWLHEYHAAREGAALFDRSCRGKLVVTGPDRFAWLQGMVTGDVRRLEAGEPAIPACVLNATGHLLAEMQISVRGDGLILDVERPLVPGLLDLLDSFVITEDVELVDQTDFLACLSLQGPAAAEEWVRQRVGDDATAVPADHTGAGGVDVYMPCTSAPAVWERLVAEGAVAAGLTAAEMLRIEAGLPRYGADMDQDTLVLEAGLGDTHVSYEKGCYVGQEIVARIRSRGHTNRALAGLVLEGTEMPAHGARVVALGGETDSQVGHVTSAAFSPALQTPIALAYVRHEHRDPGTALHVVYGDRTLPAVVSALPFVRTES